VLATHREGPDPDPHGSGSSRSKNNKDLDLGPQHWLVRIRIILITILKSSVADPDPGWVKSQYPDRETGMNSPDHVSESISRIFLG
jgi:hypothetical protein